MPSDCGSECGHYVELREVEVRVEVTPTQQVEQLRRDIKQLKAERKKLIEELTAMEKCDD
jgi:hypothetical protein